MMCEPYGPAVKTMHNAMISNHARILHKKEMHAKPSATNGDTVAAWHVCSCTLKQQWRQITFMDVKTSGLRMDLAYDMAWLLTRQEAQL